MAVLISSFTPNCVETLTTRMEADASHGYWVQVLCKLTNGNIWKPTP